MKVVKPGYQILEMPEPKDRLGVLKHLEKIGRVCYQSEDKISDESCVKFIEAIKKRKHWSILEHYIFTMDVTADVYEDIFRTDRYTAENSALVDKMPYIRGCIYIPEDYPTDSEKMYLVSGSATAFNYLWNTSPYSMNHFTAGVLKVCLELKDMIPEIMMDPIPDRDKTPARGVWFVNNDNLRNMPLNVQRLHMAQSVKFTVDRAVANEIVRHRPCSFAQESTRYCNYGEGITVVRPTWITNSSYYTWLGSMKRAEESYNEMLSIGCKPQEARAVLPNSLKADLVVTARLGEWEHIFKMRCSKAAHPDIRNIMVALRKDMREMYPGLFLDEEE